MSFAALGASGGGCGVGPAISAIVGSIAGEQLPPLRPTRDDCVIALADKSTVGVGAAWWGRRGERRHLECINLNSGFALV